MGGWEKRAVAGKHTAAHLFPLLTPYAMYHSAADGRRWRNLLRLTANIHNTASFKFEISTVQVEKVLLAYSNDKQTFT